MSPEERIALLDDARDLAQRLASKRVRGAKRGHARDEQGISPSSLGDAEAFLRHHRDLERFDRFLDRYAELDENLAPNRNNPKAERRALAEVLREARREDRGRSADAWLVVLGWARWLVRVERNEAERDTRRRR